MGIGTLHATCVNDGFAGCVPIPPLFQNQRLKNSSGIVGIVGALLRSDMFLFVLGIVVKCSCGDY